MLWFTLSLLTALASATHSTAVKKFFGDRPALEMSSYPLLWSLPMFTAALLLTPAQETAPGFWPTLAVTVPVNLAGFFLQMRAINVSPLSLTMPFLAFTPAFAVLTGYFILGETVTIWGAAGIAAVVAGGYILNLDSRKTGGPLGPFKAIARETGSRCMLGAAFFYAFTAILGKKLILLSSPLYAAPVFIICLNLTGLAFIAWRGSLNLRTAAARPLAGTAVGLLLFIEIYLHFSAVILTTAAYMVAVKRLNGLFGVIYGKALFKESQFGLRLAGAGIMALGAAMIALLG